jgi:hypothetical protein
MSAPAAIGLPPPPTADEINLAWLLENKATLAAYMQAIYAHDNAQVVVIYEGRRLPAQAVKRAGKTQIIEVLVS